MTDKTFQTIKQWWAAADQKKRWMAGLFALSVVATSVLFMTTGADGGTAADIGSSPLYYLGVFVKLLGVLLLIVGGAVVLRRWQKVRGTGTTRQLNLVETVRLNPKQALHLVRVGDQHLLIGATDQSISLISAVDIETGEDAASEPSPLSLSFEALLHSASRDQSSPSLGVQDFGKE